MKFEEAIVFLRAGFKVRRVSWHWSLEFVELYNGDKNALKELFIQKHDVDRNTDYKEDYCASNEDLLAEDWKIEHDKKGPLCQ